MTALDIFYGDEFTDYGRWKASGEREGYVFGTDWSLAYPGIKILLASPAVQDWSNRLQRPMYLAGVDTDRFCISLVFTEVRDRKPSDEVGVVRQVVIPLSGPRKP